jgi:hypothetical protein
MKKTVIQRQKIGRRPGTASKRKHFQAPEMYHLDDSTVIIQLVDGCARAALLAALGNNGLGNLHPVGVPGTWAFRVPAEIAEGTQEVIPGLLLHGNGAEVQEEWVALGRGDQVPGMYELQGVLRDLGAEEKFFPRFPTPDLGDELPEWSKPVDTGRLLAESERLFRRHLIVDEAAVPALALWSLFSFVHDAFDISPYLIFISPVMRCAKTLALELLAQVTRRPVQASSLSVAATYRAIDKYAPTLIIDECDQWLQPKGELVAILNSGNKRAMAWVIRATSSGNDLVKYSTYCPKAMAAIGELSHTLMDRSLPIGLKRKTASEHVQRLRKADLAFFAVVQQMSLRWAIDNQPELEKVDFVDTEGLTSDRANDIWSPLMAIAKLGGDAWVGKAVEAALFISNRAGDDEDIRIQLLDDLRLIFDKTHEKFISSTSLCGRLRDMEDRPWPNYPHAPGIQPHNLAWLLKRFHIHPILIRKGKQVLRGYKNEDFKDAWTRYLGDPPASPAATVTALQG